MRKTLSLLYLKYDEFYENFNQQEKKSSKILAIKSNGKLPKILISKVKKITPKIG